MILFPAFWQYIHRLRKIMQRTENRSISNIFKTFLKLLCWFLSTLAKSLKLFLLAQFSTFHASPHPRINDVGMPFMRGLATPLCLSLIIEPGVRGGRREREKVSNFWRRLKGRFAKSHVPFYFFWRRQKIENLKFWKWIFWISNGRNYRDPEAPLAVVLRGDTTTRGATSEMLITCMSKTLVNAMFFGVKRLPPGDPCCAQSTAVDNSQRNVDFLLE